MKAIFVTLLLGAAVLTLAPNASACEVSDPTGTTYTCVDQYEYAYGDCETQGDEGSGTYGSVYDPNTGTNVYANVYEYCYTYPGYNGEGSGASAGAYTPAGYAGVGYYDQTGTFGDYCSVYVYAYTPAGNQYQQVPC